MPRAKKSAFPAVVATKQLLDREILSLSNFPQQAAKLEHLARIVLRVVYERHQVSEACSTLFCSKGIVASIDNAHCWFPLGCRSASMPVSSVITIMSFKEKIGCVRTDHSQFLLEKAMCVCKINRSRLCVNAISCLIALC